MACPGNRHCANCIGALSFPIMYISAALSRKPSLEVAPTTLSTFFNDFEMLPMTFTFECANVINQRN